jgi:hypothetical protein
LKRITNSSRNGVTPIGDQREVPVEPEHDPQHAEDRHDVDDDRERSRRREVLHVDTSLVSVTAAIPSGASSNSRADRPVQVVVDADAQVVRDPLADALGE